MRKAADLRAVQKQLDQMVGAGREGRDLRTPDDRMEKVQRSVQSLYNLFDQLKQEFTERPTVARISGRTGSGNQ